MYCLLKILNSSKQVKDQYMKVYISEKVTKLSKGKLQHLSHKSKTDDVTGHKFREIADSNGVK